MSKAVLVIDMPKRCKDCFRYQADAWFGGSCKQVKDESGWNKHIDADDEYSVQNWCPLKPYQEAIPIEWIKKWCNEHNRKSLEERLLKRYGVITMLEDWEKENEHKESD